MNQPPAEGTRPSPCTFLPALSLLCGEARESKQEQWKEHCDYWAVISDGFFLAWKMDKSLRLRFLVSMKAMLGLFLNLFFFFFIRFCFVMHTFLFFKFILLMWSWFKCCVNFYRTTHCFSYPDMYIPFQNIFMVYHRIWRMVPCAVQ